MSRPPSDPLSEWGIPVFRIVCMLLAVIMFFGGLKSFENGDPSKGIFSWATACSMLALSNVLDPGKKMTFTDVKQGRARWALSPVGSALNVLAFVLYGLWMVSLVGL